MPPSIYDVLFESLVVFMVRIDEIVLVDLQRLCKF